MASQKPSSPSVNATFEHVKIADNILTISKITIQLDHTLYFKQDQIGDSSVNCVHYDVSKSKIIDSKIHFKSSETVQKLIETFHDYSANRRSKQRVFAFVNPSSGHRKGVQVFTSQVQPHLSNAGICVEHQITDKEGYNSLGAIAQRLDLDSYDALIIVGGDSSLRDVVNALWSKAGYPDPKDFRLPIFGIVPVGTGNGLAFEWYGGISNDSAIAGIVLGNIKRVRGYRVTSEPNIRDQGRFDMLGIVCLGYGGTVDAMKVSQESTKPIYIKMPFGFLSAMFNHSEPYKATVMVTLADDRQITIDKNLRDLLIWLQDINGKQISGNSSGDNFGTVLMISGDYNKFRYFQTFVQFMLKFHKREHPFVAGESLEGLVNYHGMDFKEIRVQIPPETNHRMNKDFLNVDGNTYACPADFTVQIIPQLLPCYVGV